MNDFEELTEFVVQQERKLENFRTLLLKAVEKNRHEYDNIVDASVDANKNTKKIHKFIKQIDSFKFSIDKLWEECERLRCRGLLLEKRVDAVEFSIRRIENQFASKKVCNTTLLKEPIGYLGLSARQLNCIESIGVKTIRDLVEKEEFELISIKNFGRGSLRSVRKKLNRLGLHYGMEVTKQEK